MKHKINFLVENYETELCLWIAKNFQNHEMNSL
jgi:hypothetical protein